VIPALRERFNAGWTAAQYATLMRQLQERTRGAIEFPISETPCFFPRDLVQQLADTGLELIRQSMTGDAAAAAAQVVPDQYRGAAASEPHPTFFQVDFGLTRVATGALEPRLVELQAFPSLYGFQVVLAEAYRAAYDLPPGLDVYVGGLTADEYRALVRDALLGGHDPREVVLMEIDPQRQKTRPDFAMTEQLWGVRPVDIGDIIKDGRRLFYRRDGALTQVRRIYNRVIPDELERTGRVLPFDLREELDVEWTGHPEWYFRVSKFSIPWLRHPAVPRTWFLDDPAAPLQNREQLVLKPLFSFAGGGIVFAPTDEQIASIPGHQRRDYILQERIAFEPVIDTPHGLTQAEIRMMYVWTDTLRPVLPLVRMGRGKMMGVDHNKGLRWVGASAGFLV
jgi:hypothetical protein